MTPKRSGRPLFTALALTAALLAAPPAGAAGSLVVLLRSPTDDVSGSLQRHSETLLAAELRAAGFQVGERVRNQALELRADMDAAAASLRPIAVLAVTPLGAQGSAEIWLLDRVTGKLVIRRIEPAPASATGTAGDVALRAVELLRGSLLEIALAPEPSAGGQAPPADVSRFVTAASPALPSARREHAFQGLGLGAAATVLGAFTSLGPAYAPALRMSYGRTAPHSRLALRLSGLGLGSAAQARAFDGGNLLGTARVKQTLLLFEGIMAFRPARTLQPFASAGLGLHHLSVEGSGAGPLFAGARRTRTAAALTAGGGLALRLGLRAALLLEAQALVVTPTHAVRVADQQVARVGPNALLSIGFAAGL